MIELKSLTFSYDSVPILENIEIKVEKGSNVAIIGPNGCGKSTLLKLLAGILKPNSENIMKVTDSIAYLPQGHKADSFSSTVRDFMSLMEVNLNLPAELKSKKLNSLSGGQKQLLFLQSLLELERKLYLLDEPFVFLDPYFQLKIKDELRCLAESKKTCLLVTHDINYAFEWASHILLLSNKKGRLFKNTSELNLKSMINEAFCVNIEKSESWSFTFEK